MNTEKNNYECKKEKRRKEGEKVKKKKKKRRKGQQSVTANAWPPFNRPAASKTGLAVFFRSPLFFFFF
jgi:hypothetical protein